VGQDGQVPSESLPRNGAGEVESNAAPLASARAEEVLTAVRGIGHPAAASIIRFLAEHDQAQIGQIINGAGLVRPTVNRHLRDLRALGVIEAEVAVGSAPKYRLNRDRVEQISRAHLAYMLGYNSPDLLAHTPPSSIEPA
jgi:ArsR family transcriptional regulator